MEIKNILLKNIKEYGNNPRINDQAVESVKNSIKEFGFKVPIIVDINNIIVTGHTRAKAAKLLGYEEVPCIIASDLSEKQIDAFRLVDNKVSELSTWDFEKLDKEIKKIGNDFDLTLLGFRENEQDYIDDINNVEDLLSDYDEPTDEGKRACCPSCGYIGVRDEFKTLKN